MKLTKAQAEVVEKLKSRGQVVYEVGVGYSLFWHGPKGLRSDYLHPRVLDALRKKGVIGKDGRLVEGDL